MFAYCTDDMFEIFVRLGWCLCCLLRLFVNRQVPCLHTNSRQRAVASPGAPQKPLVRKRARSGGVKWVQVSQDHQEKPVLIRDDKMKWLDFGKTPDPENLETHPGFASMKSGYSEAIAWRKVRLTKQRNVDLTTDGLWAMPLNTGWVPVKARRLQDWEKLKKYVPSHKQGDVCPNGVPALMERRNNDNKSDSE